MKKLTTIVIIFLINGIVFAQAPSKMSYQAVIRDASNMLVKNQTVGLKVSILQGSASGVTVYQETHSIVTNSNGLASTVIGQGNVISGSLDSVDWSNGPYFIQTDTDPLGGTNYTITGVSELMSVPYALFAANSGSGTTAKYSVGDFAFGGVVFWVDESGQHGLVCSVSDQSTSATWWAGDSLYTMARGNGPLSGEMNTAIIISSQGIGNGVSYAARLCNELIVTSGVYKYADWYLPSREELSLMYDNRAIINNVATTNGGTNFSSSFYWSSTENLSHDAQAQDFSNGFQTSPVKWNTHAVRAIRAF